MVDNVSEIQIYNRVKEALQQVNKAVPMDNITPEKRLQQDLDIDSIRLVDLVLNLEDEFSIHIEDSLIEGIHTVGDLIDVMKKKLA